MLRVGLILTSFGFGFRHGFDWDHIAAITDITGSQDDSRDAVRFSTLYALGHALVVFVLGLGVILLSAEIPAWLDAAMGRVVGATLVVLGAYVVYSLARHGRDFRMRSRWMLLFAGIRRAYRSLRGHTPEVVVIEHDHSDAVVPAGASHSHTHRHVAPLPDDPFMNYGTTTAIGVGMLHGVGAETPTQVLIFATAAGAGGRGAGVLVLVCFLIGLVASNTAVTLASTFGFLNSSRHWGIYATVSVVTAVFSLALGTLYLFGQDSVLPAIFSA